MSCLIAVYNHPTQFFNVDSIQTTDPVYSGTKWYVNYYGLNPKRALTTEYYPTQDIMKARLLQIEKLVNSKCGTNVKITIKK